MIAFMQQKGVMLEIYMDPKTGAISSPKKENPIFSRTNFIAHPRDPKMRPQNLGGLSALSRRAVGSKWSAARNRALRTPHR